MISEFADEPVGGEAAVSDGALETQNKLRAGTFSLRSRMTDRPSTASARSESFEEALAIGRHTRPKPVRCVEAGETLVRLKKDARVFRLAAEACRKLGLKADAEGAELGAIEANLQQPELKEAAQLLADGQPTDALDKAYKFLATHPDDLLAMTIAAEALMALGTRALRSPAEICDGSSTDVPPRSMLLATCLGKQVRLRQAISVIEEALLRKPNHAQLLSRLAQLRSNVGDNEEAVR